MISIIIPVYNASPYLYACVESCLAQSYRDFELIAVNDGSTDNSGEILEEYARKDSRITIINKENEGLPKARETGIAKARSEYVFFLDADDTITPDALEILWNEAQASGCDMIIGQIAVLTESGRIIADTVNKCIYPESEQSLICSILSKSILPSLCGKLIKKRLFEKIMFPYQYTIGEDVITILEIIKAHSPSLSIFNQRVYNYIQHPGSMVNINNTTTADMRMKYMVWVYEYLRSIEHSEELKNCMAKFFIEEYFSFLRDGGTDCPVELKERIYGKYLRNRWAVSHTALRIEVLIKIYKLSPTLGKITRRILVSIKKIIRQV